MTTLRVYLAFLFVAAVSMVACSGSSDASNGGGGSAGGDDDAGVVADGAGGATDGAQSDGSGGDAGSDGAHHDGAAPDAGTALVPNPPAGATQCGHGTFTSGDVVTACQAPSFTLDDYMQIDGGFTAVPRNCGALSTAGGSWEAWCTAKQVYVWARFDQVTNLGATSNCHGDTVLSLDYGAYDGASQGGTGALVSTYEANGTLIVGTPPSDPQTAVFTMTIQDSSTHAGADVFVLGSVGVPGDFCPDAPQLPTVFAGAHVTWSR